MTEDIGQRFDIMSNIFPGEVERKAYEFKSSQTILQNHPQLRVVYTPETSYCRLRLFLQCKETGIEVGQVCGEGVPGERNTLGIAYRIDKKYQGQGLISALLKDYILTSPRQAFSVSIYADNEASLRVARKNDFQEIKRYDSPETIVCLVKYK